MAVQNSRSTEIQDPVINWKGSDDLSWAEQAEFSNCKMRPGQCGTSCPPALRALAVAALEHCLEISLRGRAVLGNQLSCPCSMHSMHVASPYRMRECFEC